MQVTCKGSWRLGTACGECSKCRDEARHLIPLLLADNFQMRELHGKFGRWLFGGATVDGWTWVGFDTEAAMSEFRAAWPPPSGVPLPG
jgi:hypothetical protein